MGSGLTTDSRLSSFKRGYDSRWQKAREGYLRANPFCVDCEGFGRLTPATVVDHIKPHRLGDAIESGDAEKVAEARKLFWDKTNWQALCKLCHDSHKQRLEKSGTVFNQRGLDF